MHVPSGICSDPLTYTFLALSPVVSITSNSIAFAALRADGSVVTWGSSTSGGDSSSVANRLRHGVTKLFSVGGSNMGFWNFGALFDDDSALMWGSSSDFFGVPLIL